MRAHDMLTTTGDRYNCTSNPQPRRHQIKYLEKSVCQITTLDTPHCG